MPELNFIDIEHALKMLNRWSVSATNGVEILPSIQDIVFDEDELFGQAFSSAHDLFHSVISFTGGILVNNGFIRILGSGNNQLLNRSFYSWNENKTFQRGTPVKDSSYVFIADDIVGGFFALNRGYFSKTNLGSIYYYTPDYQEWISLDIDYNEFLIFCFDSDLESFYEPFHPECLVPIASDMTYFFLSDDVDGHIHSKLISIEKAYQIKFACN